MDRNAILTQLKELWRNVPSVNVPRLLKFVSDFAEETKAECDDLLAIAYLFLARKLEEHGIFMTKSAFVA